MLVSAVVCRTGALDDVDFNIKYSRVVVTLMLLMFIDIGSASSKSGLLAQIIKNLSILER